MKHYIIQLAFGIFTIIQTFIKLSLLNDNLQENAGGAVFFGYIYIYLLLFLISIIFVIIIIAQFFINYFKIRMLQIKRDDWILLTSLIVSLTLLSFYWKSEFDIDLLILLNIFIPIYSIVVSSILNKEMINKYKD